MDPIPNHSLNRRRPLLNIDLNRAPPPEEIAGDEIRQDAPPPPPAPVDVAAAVQVNENRDQRLPRGADNESVGEKEFDPEEEMSHNNIIIIEDSESSTEPAADVDGKDNEEERFENSPADEENVRKWRRLNALLEVTKEDSDNYESLPVDPLGSMDGDLPLNGSPGERGHHQGDEENRNGNNNNAAAAAAEVSVPAVALPVVTSRGRVRILPNKYKDSILLDTPSRRNRSASSSINRNTPR